jgi:hypothetical protein
MSSSERRLPNGFMRVRAETNGGGGRRGPYKITLINEEGSAACTMALPASVTPMTSSPSPVGK